jgi:hypothetical protein
MFDFLKKVVAQDSPENFKLEVVPSWFSNDYVSFRYTTNGVTWKTIQCARAPFLSDDDWKMEHVAYRLGDGNFTYEKAQWDSKEKIEAYEANERQHAKTGQVALEEERVQREVRRKEAFKRANS